jgi:hypothetical protein
MTTLTYSDAYLRTLVTDARELRATVEVAELGTLPANWVTRLTIIRAYMITCTECLAEPNDTFAAKLSAYRKEFDQALVQARSAQALIDAAAGKLTGGGSMFTVPLERG